MGKEKVRRIGAEILARMPEVAASTGSACHSGQITLSPVLQAMQVAPEIGMGAIRSLEQHDCVLRHPAAVFAARPHHCRWRLAPSAAARFR